MNSCKFMDNYNIPIFQLLIEVIKMYLNSHWFSFRASSFLLVFLVLFSHLSAQEPSSESFFPHKVGDKWQYHYAEDNSFFFEEITQDSIAEDSSVYLEINNKRFYGWSYRVDKQNNVFYLPQCATVNFLLYKSYADSGDVWNERVWENGYAQVARVEDVFEDIIFGVPTVVKKISYYSDSTYRSWLESRYFASGFGMILLQAEATPYYYVKMLTGCCIDGQCYGTLVGVEKSDIEPFSFKLEQNYPNPFNPSTTISFETDKYSLVELKVFDTLGREVSTLLKDYKSPGRYSVVFNAGNIPSGIYFYRITTDQHSIIKKMILTK